MPSNHTPEEQDRLAALLKEMQQHISEHTRWDINFHFVTGDGLVTKKWRDKLAAILAAAPPSPARTTDEVKK